MKRSGMFLGASLACLLAGGAFAQDCEARIAELEPRLDAAAEHAISASSGGQGVAGSREAEAMEAAEGEGEVPEEAVAPYQREEEEAEAVERAEGAGEGGDLVMQAQARLEEARTAATDGDEAACEEAVAEVAALLEELELGQAEQGAGEEAGSGG